MPRGFYYHDYKQITKSSGMFSSTTRSLRTELWRESKHSILHMYRFLKDPWFCYSYLFSNVSYRFLFIVLLSVAQYRFRNIDYCIKELSLCLCTHRFVLNESNTKKFVGHFILISFTIVGFHNLSSWDSFACEFNLFYDFANIYFRSNWDMIRSDISALHGRCVVKVSLRSLPRNCVV